MSEFNYQRLKVMEGTVYILSNDAYKEGILKIGMTRRRAQDRANEIFQGATGTPSPFYVEYERQTKNCAMTEELIHQRLDEYRFSPNREFFKISLELAKQIVNEIANDVDLLYARHSESYVKEREVDTAHNRRVQVPQKPETSDIIRGFHSFKERFSFECLGCHEAVEVTMPQRPNLKLKCPFCGLDNRFKYRQKELRDPSSINHDEESLGNRSGSSNGVVSREEQYSVESEYWEKKLKV